jgi:hypothetical protein
LDQLVSGRLVTGARVVVEALYRRLITPRGMLGGGLEESTYGLDIAGYIGALTSGAGVTPANGPTLTAVLTAMVRNECLKDDRVSTVAVDASIIDRGDGTYALLIEITGSLVDEDESFALTLDVDGVSTQFLGGIQ